MQPKKRRGPNLFEVMNKAHLNQPAARRSPWLGTPSRQNGMSPVTTVAQALTEEEAAAELSAARIAAEKAKLEQQAVEATRLARAEQRQLEKEELRRARQAAKTAKYEARQKLAEERAAARAQQRAEKALAADEEPSRAVPINSSTLLAFAGLVVVVAIVGFALGRGATKPGEELPKAAAIIPGSSSSHLSPLVPKIPDQEKPKDSAKPASPETNPNLARLLQPVSKGQEKQAVANQPLATTPRSRGVTGPALPENLNYLQIESFPITRDRSGEQVAQDVADARKFLIGHGIRTFARRKSNGYVLFAEEGHEPAKNAAATRDAFRRKIESLGLEYRRSGGLYQFKGCLFVSYAATQTGDPA